MRFTTGNISSFFDPEILVGKVLDGRYEILEYIGRGGMGIVYKVYDRDLDKIRAIKVPPPEIGADALAESRLKKETQRASDLSHENIINVFNLEVSRSPGETNGLRFILMEFIDGKSLNVILSEREGQKLQEKEALEIMLPVARALLYAHEKGVIHLDLKPQNIMIETDGTVKVLDFGIAMEIRTSMSRVSRAGQQLTAGTLPYMAPEQVSKRFGRPDERTDIWGFGATLYHLVTGELPFESERQIMEDPLLWEGIEVSEGVKALIERCMEKKKEDRFQNFGEVMSVIEKLLKRKSSKTRAKRKTQKRTKTIKKVQRKKTVASNVALKVEIDRNLVEKMKKWHQEKKNQEFIAAITAKDPIRAIELIEAGAELNYSDEEGSTPLHLAAAMGEIEIVKALIGKGIDPNIRNKKGETALHSASKMGHKDIITFLIESGADPSIKDSSDWTPLHLAAIYGRVESIKALVKLGVDPNITDNANWTPLHKAASEGKIDAIKTLIELGADPNAKDNADWTPLHDAASKGKIKAIRTLVKLGADPNAKDKNGETPLHKAASEGKIKAIRTLIELGADPFGPYAEDKNGSTPLHLAASEGKIEAIRTLIELGADPNAEDRIIGGTPLHYAVLKGKIEAIRTLIELGADPNAKDRYEDTPLHYAVGRTKAIMFLFFHFDIPAERLRVGEIIKAIRTLVKLGADPNAKDINGSTPLHLAASEGKIKAIRTLIELGADPNAKDINGSTPLHLAASYGEVEAVRVLVESGADPDIKDFSGKTPLALAKYSIVKKLLKKYSHKRKFPFF